MGCGSSTQGAQPVTTRPMLPTNSSTARTKPMPMQEDSDERARKILESQALKLLRVDWLLAQPADYVLQRCQDLPAEAFLSGAQAAKLWMDNLRIAVLSYGWLTKQHPDPNGHHMRRVRKCLQRLREWQPWASNVEGVFWDFAALPQNGIDGSEKTDEEEVVLKAGLGAINVLYASLRTFVLQLTAVPMSVEAPARFLVNHTPYELRGWCHFEAIISSVLKDTFFMFDLGKVDAALLDDNTDAHAVFTDATGTRLPPATPEDLEQALQKLNFTSGADRGMVVKKYAVFFADAASTATELCFDNRADSSGWGDFEIQQLSRALQAFTACKVLSLSGHSISDQALELITEALSRMPQLEKLFLTGPLNTFGASSVELLQKQIEACPSLKLLWLPEHLADTAAGKALSALASAKSFQLEWQ